MRVNEDRELYDLCRKYKFFYKKCEDLKKCRDKYHDKNIRNAYSDAKKELDNVAWEIYACLIGTYTGTCELECEVIRGNYKTPFRPHASFVSHIYGKEFYDLMQNLKLFEGVRRMNG